MEVVFAEVVTDFAEVHCISAEVVTKSAEVHYFFAEVVTNLDGNPRFQM